MMQEIDVWRFFPSATRYRDDEVVHGTTLPPPNNAQQRPNNAQILAISSG